MKHLNILLTAALLASLILTGCEGAGSPSGFSASLRRPAGQEYYDYADEDGYTDMQVPSEYLSAYEIPAKQAIRTHLNVEVPGDALITYSYYDETDTTLTFTWTTGDPDYPDAYYSVSYYNAVPEEGSGELYYLYASGASIADTAELLSKVSLAAFTDLLGQQVPPDYQPTTEISYYNGNRTALFIWEYSPDACSLSTYYSAGYEDVDPDYSDGTLTLLSVDAYEYPHWEDGPYTDAEVDAMRQAAEAFIASGPEKERNANPDYLGYTTDTPDQKGNLSFYFTPMDADYASMIVTVNPEGGILSYVLSRENLDYGNIQINSSPMEDL